MRQKLLVDIGGTLEYKFYLHSLQQIPTSAKIIIYDDGGNEKVAETDATIEVGVGTMTYIVLPAIADNVYYNWQARWKFIVDGVTYYRKTIFYIVNQILTNPVVDEDIIHDAPFLAEKNYNQIETAESGSAITIVNVNFDQKDDYWNGGEVEVVGGTNFGEKRKVTDFDSASNKLTTEVFSAAIDITSIVKVTRTFKKEIDRAFDRFELDMKNRGIFIDRIIDSEQVKEYIQILAYHYICDNFSTDPLDNWAAKAESYLKDYNNLLGVAVFDYDTDDDGNIETDEEKNALLQVQGVR